MAHDINDWIARLGRQFYRVDESANVMAQPVAWAEFNDLNPVTTWAEGRAETVKQLRDLARLASEIADVAEALPPYAGAREETT